MSTDTRTILLNDGARALRLRRFSVVSLPDGERHVSSGARLTIGASPDCDICLVSEDSVSRAHARIEASADGYTLRDLGSKNGTWLGGFRIDSARLVDGAEFKLGTARLRFALEDDEIEIHYSGQDHFGELFGSTPIMREVFGMLERVAPTEATLLVEGESGTGKELVARAVHAASPRADGPLVVFDCSAVSPDLIESELFGHVKGAFTGAVAPRKGAFEEAEGGTLFLDELGELRSDLQPKLLRALERREVRPVGSNDVRPVNVRIVAATNRNLKEEVRRGNFREDLYYRLAVLQLRLPPLRERLEDIPLLTERFLREIEKRGSGADLSISFSTMEKLKKHEWPGNVRELRNFVERAAILSAEGRIETRFIEGQPPQPATKDAEGSKDESLPIDVSRPFKEAKNDLVENFERAYWTELLRVTAGNVTRAADMAGIHRKSVEYILRKLDIRRDDLSN